MAMLFLLCAELLIVGSLIPIAFSKYNSFVKEKKHVFRFLLLAPLSLWVLDRLKLADHLSEVLSRIHHLMAGLYGSKTALPRTRGFTADVISFSVSGLVGSTMLAWITEGGIEILLYGCCLILLIPFVMFKELAGRLLKKKRRMLLELPEMLNQIVLLVNAGETVQSALMRCAELNVNKNENPLLTEMSQVAHELRMNASFSKSLEDFNKRCGIQEVSLFTTTLLLNYKRGGDELVMSLKELSFTLWERRKSLAKTLGEEASSKMVFPMVLIFLVVMVVVAAPAVLMMG